LIYNDAFVCDVHSSLHYRVVGLTCLLFMTLFYSLQRKYLSMSVLPSKAKSLLELICH